MGISTGLMAPHRNDAAVQLLWTGGWDSTYRLLDLVLVQGRPVQPYYLIDANRRSTLIELQTRERIRAAAIARSPAVRDLLLPSIIADMGDLHPEPELHAWLDGLRQNGWLGKQYVPLAAFASAHGLDALELSINREDRPRLRLADDVTPAPDDPRVYQLAVRLTDPNLEIFRHFRFPIFDISKREMQEMARRGGFADLMELTWFCHTPRRGQPCGTCAPCRDIIGEGLGRRLPPMARVRCWLQSLSSRPGGNVASFPRWT